MNKEPIENARDRDLRSSFAALKRAARRAHELAAQTGTLVIVSRDGVVEQISPESLLDGEDMSVPGAPSGNEP
jgi:hypothetical protein